MQAKLFCKTGPLAGTSYDVQGEVTIGKSPGNSIQLTPAIISGKHARIMFDPKRSAFYIEDLGSTNGTWVDGMRVKGKERLDRLNIISFADSFDFIFQIIGQGAATPKEAAPSRPGAAQAAKVEQQPKRAEQKTIMDDGGAFMPPQKPPSQPAMARNATVIDDGKTPAPMINPQQQKKEAASGQQASGQKTKMDDGGAFIPPPKPASPPPVNERSKNATVFDDGSPIPQFVVPGQAQEKKAAVAPMKFVLDVKSPTGSKAYDMKEGENTIGREASCDIFIEDSSMSRKHAVIVLKSGEFTINDLGSKNGTFLGSEKVSTERKLRPGDDLQFGNITARLSGKSTT